jgi:CxxC motif-containing protein (DUF1111 family)
VNRTWLLIFAFIALAAVFVIAKSAGRRHVTPPGNSSEASTGFDNISIEIAADPDNKQHAADRKFFDEVEQLTPDGLGPIYNAQSCRECHQNGGQNPPAPASAEPVSGAASQVVEARAGHLGANGTFEAPVVQIEGDMIVGRTLINDRAICQLAQERVPETETILTNRLALGILGDGFIESVTDQTLLDIQKQQCNSAGGICGVAIWVPVLEASGAENKRIGRFGWKDQHASLLSFAADAYLNEMGITSRLQPEEVTLVCNPAVSAAKPPAKPPAGTVTEPNSQPDPNDNNLEDIDHFARFMRATKAPPRDASLAATPAAMRGEKLFSDIGCAICHVSNMRTAPSGTKLNGGTFTVTEALGSKVFHPYSDFLLHDVGTGDGIAIAALEHYGRGVTRQLNNHDAAKLGRPAETPVDATAMPALRDKSTVQKETAPKPSQQAAVYTQGGCDSRLLAASQQTAVESLFYRTIQCAANKLRTPPLWGLHMRSRLMHDGNSLQIGDAIKRHKGEALAITDKFNHKNDRDKQDIITFLNSL